VDWLIFVKAEGLKFQGYSTYLADANGLLRYASLGDALQEAQDVLTRQATCWVRRFAGDDLYVVPTQRIQYLEPVKSPARGDMSDE